MPIASTWLDVVVGVDMHIEMVPTPAPTPTPFPHPHCSVVWDPIGYIVGEVTGMLYAAATGQPIDPSGPVLIGGRMATVTGDAAAMPVKHIVIPPGTTFLTGVTDSDAELLVGSKTVLVRGSNAVRAGEVALSCSDPVRLPTAAVISTSGGPSLTMIGGPPAIDFGAAVGMLGMGALRNKWTSTQLHKLVDAVLPQKWQRLRRLAHKSACFFTGHPVNVASGTVSTGALDLELPGPIPLRFAREYDSNWADRDSALGHGWSHSLDQRIWLERDCVVLLGEDGRELEFATGKLPERVMRAGDSLWHPVDRLTLRAQGELRWEVRSADGLVRVFAPIAGESAQGRDRGVARLVAIRSAAGHAIALHYDERARLQRIVDSDGRTIELEHDANGHLRRLWAPAPDGRGLRQHAEYRYDAAGDLVAVVDALGASWSFEYDDHLLVREQDRCRLSFYFVYDGRDGCARCVRTWGDGGIYDHVIDYDRSNLTTIVTNSLGEVTKYKMNGLGLVTEILQPDGTKRAREYGPETWLATEIDELGHATRYHYDERGNQIAIAEPRGDAGPVWTKSRYDDFDRLLEVRDAEGDTHSWRYDSAGRLVARIDPLGHTTTYVWEDRVLTAIVDAAGTRTSLRWDRAGNLVETTHPDGTTSSHEYDALGRVVRNHDAKGNTERRFYDAVGRVVRVEPPDGNVLELERDAEGRVVRARDRLRDVRLEYVGLGWLASRTVGNHKVGFRRDTQGQLVGVIDERGLEHQLELDPLGRVRAEIASDGLTTRFERDAVGRIVSERRPDDTIVRHDYDAAGCRRATSYADGTTDRFSYDRLRRLCAADNAHVRLRFERDASGRVVREISVRDETSHDDRREVVVERRFDHLGRRIGMRSSLGADVTLQRNEMGDPVRISQAGGEGRMHRWEARFSYDALGEEIDRVLLGGGRSFWWRDAVGRPTQHWIGREQQSHRTRRYRWDVDDRLLAITERDAVETAFEHDGRGALVSATWNDGRIEGRFPDEVGNLFATSARSDREYGRAGEIRKLATPEGVITYEYDAQGRLSRRRMPNLECWRYHWNDAGRLAQVDRPDRTAVAMAYDALGRRVWKNHLGKLTWFVWDGERPLHEWSEAADVPVRRPEPGEDARRGALLDLRTELARVLDADAFARRWESLLAQAESRGFAGLVVDLRARERAEVVAPPSDAAGPVLTWLFEPGRFAPMARLSVDAAHSIIADHVGTPLVLLDEQGAAKTQLVTDTHGLATTSGDASLCPFRFAGQYRDDETELHYNRFRHYDPNSGTYVSRDPLGLRAGLRAYAYVDDPLVATDPLGLSMQAGAGEGCGTSSEPGPGSTRVGRWMSPAELEAMQATGRVQPSAGGQTHVTAPANPDSFRAAPPGSVFAEFDVPADRVHPGGKEGWGIVAGPDSVRGKLHERKTGERLEMPPAENIAVVTAD